MRNAMLCTLSLLALGAVAQAQNATTPPGASRQGDRPRQTVEDRFKLLDANKDGKISESEYAAGPTPRGGDAARVSAARTARFKTLDTNKDGYLSLDEYKAGRANTGQGRQGRNRRSQSEKT